ncbi:MAG: VOC family protein [Thermoanaerobaculia bacterium]
MQVNPYLFFNGQCEEAFNTYARILGGKIEAMIKHQGSPAEGHVPPEWGDKIMHAMLRVGDGALMASDAPPEHQERPQGFSVSIHFTDVAEAERVFNALAEGGKVNMPFSETFWAVGFGMLVDRFGIPWMVNVGKEE